MLPRNVVPRAQRSARPPAGVVPTTGLTLTMNAPIPRGLRSELAVSLKSFDPSREICVIRLEHHFFFRLQVSVGGSYCVVPPLLSFSDGQWNLDLQNKTHAQKILLVRFGNRGALLPSLRKRRISHFSKKSILFPKDVSSSRQLFHRQGLSGETVSFRSIASPTPSTHIHTHTCAVFDNS